MLNKMIFFYKFNFLLLNIFFHLYCKKLTAFDMENILVTNKWWSDFSVHPCSLSNILFLKGRIILHFFGLTVDYKSLNSHYSF